MEGDDPTIEDLGSMNGTTLGDEKLVKRQPKTVRVGMHMGLGDVEFDTHFLKG